MANNLNISDTFIDYAFSQGWATGDPEYWKKLPASSTEWKDFVAAVQPFVVESAFTDGSATGDQNYWNNLDPSSPEWKDLFVTLPQEQGGGVTTNVAEGDVTSAEQQVQGGVGTAGASIMTSNEMKWFFDRSKGLWYVEYGLPNSNLSMLFEATPQQLDGLFGTNQRPANFQEQTLTQLLGGDRIFSGTIAEVTGSGTFESEIQRVVSLALGDNRLPRWATADGRVLDLLFIAQSEGKSDQWLIEQIAKEPSFKERFKGIEHFLDLGLDVIDSVTAYGEFETGVKAIQGVDPASVTPQIIQQLLEKQHSLEDVKYVYDIFTRMEQFAPALDAFNSVLTAQGKQPLDTNGQFEFLTGTAPPDLYQAWEASTLLSTAESAGLGDFFDANRAIGVALETPGITSPQQAAQSFQEAARLILRLRTQIDINKYELTADDLIDLSMGIMPQSGMTATEVTDRIQRAVSEATAWVQDSQTQPFFSFSQRGIPQASSLQGFRSEG